MSSTSPPIDAEPRLVPVRASTRRIALPFPSGMKTVSPTSTADISPSVTTVGSVRDVGSVQRTSPVPASSACTAYCWSISPVGLSVTERRSCT